jgi:hypothetical protein
MGADPSGAPKTRSSLAPTAQFFRSRPADCRSPTAPALAAALELPGGPLAARGAAYLDAVVGEEVLRLAERVSSTKECGLVAEVYVWFIEGFDTADLSEAASFLKVLS